MVIWTIERFGHWCAKPTWLCRIRSPWIPLYGRCWRWSCWQCALRLRLRTNPYMASAVKRAYGISSRFFWLCWLSIWLGPRVRVPRRPMQCQLSAWTGSARWLGSKRLSDCVRVSHLRLRQAKLIAGVTHSNPYPTVGPGRHEAGRDGGTNGNVAVFNRVPRRRSTSFPW